MTLKKYIQSRIIPAPQKIECLDGGMFRLADECKIKVVSPLPSQLIEDTIIASCKSYWQMTPCISVIAGGYDLKADGYNLLINENLCEIQSSCINGIHNAMKTLRQLAESERCVLKATCHNLPSVRIEDQPAMTFRGIHFCWFPETTLWEMEKNIRMAAYYKFNYAVIESWGMIRLDSHPEYCWEEFAVEKREVKRLVNLAADLGLTLIPQVNLFGHASSSRCGTGKHMLLDRFPEYAPLFEPDGWTWCLSNPHTRKYLSDIVLEFYELFDKPSFFHIGCDEAYNAGSCSLCADEYPKKVKDHILFFHKLFAERDTRIMMWHDMLLCRDDPRWDGYIVCGHSKNGLQNLYEELPHDIVICDWQYGTAIKDEKRAPWPTSSFFHECGYEVLVCPWLEAAGTKDLGKFVKQNHLFGLLETTWHLYRGSHNMTNLFLISANAAWNPGWKEEEDITYTEYLNRHLREISHDMKLDHYIQFGSIQYQIAKSPHQG